MATNTSRAAVNPAAPLLRSLNAYKGHFTRAANAFEKQTIAVQAAAPTTHACDAIKDAYETTKARWAKIEPIYDNLVGLVEEDDLAALEDDRAAYEERLANITAEFIRLSGELRDRMTPAAPGAAVTPATGAGGGGANRVKEAKSLKPDKLRYDDTHVRLRKWLGDMTAYWKESNFSAASAAGQHAYFLACLDDKLVCRIRSAIMPAARVFNMPGSPVDPESLEGLVRAEFDSLDSLFSRRYRYRCLTMAKGELLSDYHRRLREEVDECQPNDMTPDTDMALRLVTDCSDPVLKDELLKTSGELGDIIKAYKAYETRQATLTRTTGTGSRANIINYVRGNCGRCGGTCRPKDKACPAIYAECLYCGLKGHFKSVCNNRRHDEKATKGSGRSHKLGENNTNSKSKGKKTEYQRRKLGRSNDGGTGNSGGARPKKLVACKHDDGRSDLSDTEDIPRNLGALFLAVKREDPGAAVLPAIMKEKPLGWPAEKLRHPWSRRTQPIITCQVSPCSENNCWTTVNALADTGATVTILNPELAKACQLKVTKNPGTITVGDGSKTEIIGSTTMLLSLKTRNGLTEPVRINADVGKVQHMVLGFNDCQDLNIVPPDCPEPYARWCPGCKSHQLSVVSSDHIHECKATRSASEFNTLVPKILEKWKKVFDDTTVQPMLGKPMHIYLAEGARPVKVCTARQTPKHLEEGAAKVLDMALRSGVIVKVEEPTEWISPAFFVQKPDPSKARLVTDYSALNRFVHRPVHTFPSPLMAIRAIDPKAKLFAKLDAVSGYFQIPLDKASSLLTTFILPTGRYRYTRAPMGLSSSSDEFCRRTDEALVGLPGLVKVVDDILVMGRDRKDLEEKLDNVLRACARHRITLSKDKFEVGTKVKFAGYVISADGIRPDKDKVAAIADFPIPKDTTGVRSFIGLANQLGIFVENMSAMNKPLRDLLRANVAFVWGPEQERAFAAIKEVLTSDLCVTVYDEAKPTILYTDASSVHGMGYVLTQEGKTVVAGSRSLTDAETRYSVIELEATAVAWSMKHCRFYLEYNPGFTVKSDHRPLVGIFKKALDSIDNSRLVRIRESVSGYRFTVEHIPGKENLAADALSRNPAYVASMTTVDMFTDIHLTTPVLSKIAAATADDIELSAACSAIRRKLCRLPKGHPAGAFSKIFPSLSLHRDGVLIKDSRRIVVPKSMRRELLEVLHRGHAGINKTLALARDLYYWPGMANEVEQLVEACSECQRVRQAQPRENYDSDDRVVYEPMEMVSADILTVAGQKWLVLADRYSSFPLAVKLKGDSTSRVCDALKKWFNVFGWPSIISTDNGPCFRKEFVSWLTDHLVGHNNSAAYDHESNGLAEAAVKRVRHLIEKTHTEAEFRAALDVYRRTPMADGRPAPATAFFGRRLRHPDLPSLPAPREEMATSADTDSLKVGDEVLVYDANSKRWDTSGIIIGRRKNGRSFQVDRGTGKPTLRARHHLKPSMSQKKASVTRRKTQ